jgi:hypothetical protein
VCRIVVFSDKSGFVAKFSVLYKSHSVMVARVEHKAQLSGFRGSLNRHFSAALKTLIFDGAGLACC